MPKNSSFFIKQDPMRRVLYALTPIFLWSTYLYGWRVPLLLAFVVLLASAAEFVFEKSRGKKVTEAVWVTGGLFALSLPPAVPFWVAGVGIFFAVIIGKEVFGGFGRNLYNPAITGRTFVYISFPLMMQTTWMIPGNFAIGGSMNLLIQGSTFPEAAFMTLLAAGLYWWFVKSEGKTGPVIRGSIVAVVLTVAFYVTTAYLFPYTKGHANALSDLDAVAMATPLEVYRGLAQAHDWHRTVSLFGMTFPLDANNPLALFLGLRVGSIGEGPIFLIILAGLYLMITKTANWRPLIWTLVSALGFTLLFYFSGMMDSRFPVFAAHRSVGGLATLGDLAGFLMSGSLMFAAVFMATDPVSAPKKPLSQAIYGIIIGSLTITIRVFAGFPEGVSFAILTANTFAMLLDEILPPKKKEAVAPKVAAKAGGES